MPDKHFVQLWNKVAEMGAERAKYTPEKHQNPDFVIDTRLKTGIEIDISELEPDAGGLLSIHGRQVLLYIADQKARILDVLEEPSRGSKFHVAECQTLIEMKRRGRFDRYVVTNNLNGNFSVSGVTFEGDLIKGEAELDVCKNCLRFLNYRGYASGGIKSKIFRSFTIEQFFESYSTLFKHLPRDWVNKESGYAKDWADISARVRGEANWICQQCGVDLNTSKWLLHTHHRDGNTQNNIDSNLVALCVDCHRKQPFHESMFISPKDMAEIQRLRRQQYVIAEDSVTWDEVFEFVDPAFEGAARLVHGQNFHPPEVGVDICDSNGAVVMMAELAWPDRRYAIVRDEDELADIEKAGWTGRTLLQALNYYA